MSPPQDSTNLLGALFGGPSNTTQTPSDRLAFASLLAANILPILLALAFGWDVGDVVTFYWLENIIIGLWVIPRLVTAQGRLSLDPSELSNQLSKLSESTVASESPSKGNNTKGEATIERAKLFLIPFFCFHYFFFCFVHGVFVSVFASGAITGNTTAPLPLDTPEGGSWPGPLIIVQFFYSLISNSLASLSTGGLLAVGGLAIGHGVSFFRNYIGHGEYTQAHAIIEMFRPYPRIVVLHLGIMAGGIATLLLGSPLLLVIALMIGKTVLDAKLHIASHTPRTEQVV
jgi:hypothetical protein